MRPVVLKDGVAWPVCRSLCHDREPSKNCWTDRDAVWAVASGWPKEPCIRWSRDTPCEGAILMGKGRPIVKYRDLLP